MKIQHKITKEIKDIGDAYRHYSMSKIVDRQGNVYETDTWDVIK